MKRRGAFLALALACGLAHADMASLYADSKLLGDLMREYPRLTYLPRDNAYVAEVCTDTGEWAGRALENRAFGLTAGAARETHANAMLAGTITARDARLADAMTEFVNAQPLSLTGKALETHTITMCRQFLER
jgi:hypothetical protein